MRPATILAATAACLWLVLTAPPGAAQRGLPACPETMLEVARPTECSCTSEATLSGTIWGTDIYTADSGTCRAARHAGAIGRDGGPIRAIPAGAQPSYRGSSRNGIATEDYGPYGASFRIEGIVAASTGPRLCPDTFRAYAGETAPFACLCPGEATLRGNVWGTGIYTDDSAICRAAVHAGVITPFGGDVTVLPRPGQASYLASRQNRVESNSYGDWPNAYTFENMRDPGTPGDKGPTGRVVRTGPVQAPIRETLTSRGLVQLYINFRTNSAELDPPAIALLGELRAALQAEPGLRLALAGHTDSTGNATINKPLSQRRADSVRAWLVARGIAADRLTTAGRGPDEPIADNATEEGRSLNRRVSAQRL